MLACRSRAHDRSAGQGAAATAPPASPSTSRVSRGRDHRLRGAAAFEAVLRNGKRREGRYVQIVTAPMAAATPSAMGRFGFIVSSKVMPRAVDRNRFKRVLRAKLAEMRDAIRGLDLVIRIKRKVPPEARVQALTEAAALLDEVLLRRHPKPQ